MPKTWSSQSLLNLKTLVLSALFSMPQLLALLPLQPELAMHSTWLDPALPFHRVRSSKPTPPMHSQRQSRPTTLPSTATQYRRPVPNRCKQMEISGSNKCAKFTKNCNQRRRCKTRSASNWYPWAQESPGGFPTTATPVWSLVLGFPGTYGSNESSPGAIPCRNLVSPGSAYHAIFFLTKRGCAASALITCFMCEPTQDQKSKCS